MVLILSRALKIVLCLAMGIAAPSLGTAQAVVTVSDKIEAFYEKYADEYSYALNMQELYQLYIESGSTGAAVLNRVDVARNEIDRIKSTPRPAWENLEQILVPRREEAVQIVDEIFELESMEEINLQLLGLMFDYVTRPEIRGQISHILEAMSNKNFSEQDLIEMEKKKSNVRNGLVGFDWTSKLIVAIGAIGFVSAALKGKVSGGFTSVMARLGRLGSRAGDEALEAAKASSRAAEEAAAVERRIIELTRRGETYTDEYIELAGRQESYDRLKAVLARNTQLTGGGSQATATKVAVSIPKFNLLKSVTNTIKGMDVNSMWRGLVHITGASIVGGGTWAGLTALERKFNPDMFKDAPFDPKILRDDYYDGLAVLHMSCGARELHFEVASATELTQEQINEYLFKLNIIYADYTVMKVIAEEAMEIFPLNQAITYNGTTGNVEFDLVLRDHVESREFACQSKYGAESLKLLESSIHEVKIDIRDAFFRLMDKQAELTLRNTENNEPETTGLEPSGEEGNSNNEVEL